VLELAPQIRAAILGRVRENLSLLRMVVAGAQGVGLLEPEGGWSAVLHFSRSIPDEEVVLQLLERTGVLVHPGYFFDFSNEDYLVLSLLPAYEERGIGRRLLALVIEHLAALGHRRLFLGCSADPATRSHGFYRHLGWVSTGTVDRAGDEVLELFPQSLGVSLSDQQAGEKP